MEAGSASAGAPAVWPRLAAALPAARTAGLAVALAVPGAVATWLAFHAGGYFAGGTATAALMVAAALALRALLARAPWEGIGPAVAIAAGLLAAFAAWTLASASWSDLEARALIEYDRALLYLLAFLLCGSIARTPARIRWLVRLTALALLAVCVTALVAKLLPAVLETPPNIEAPRLAWPLTYWNALGLVAALCLVLCGHLTCDDREHPVVRVLGAAAAPVPATALVLTASRGAMGAAAAGTLAYLALARPRAAATGGLVAMAAAGVAAWIAYHAEDLDRQVTAAVAESAGREMALILAGCALGAGAARAALLPLDARIARIELPSLRRPPVFAAVAAATIALAAGGIVALDVPDRIDRAYAEFRDDDAAVGASTGRLRSLNGSGRVEHWRVALESFREDRWRGRGAGTYADAWQLHRSAAGGNAHDGHSLYVETLGELGMPGLALLAAALLTILVGTALKARGPDRAQSAAIAAIILAWALAAAFDWHWEMPAVTLPVLCLGGAALARAGGESMRTPLPAWATLTARAAAIAACLAVAAAPWALARSQDALDRGVAAFERGDCATAQAAALQAVDRLKVRPEPWELLAYCAVRGGHEDLGVRAIDRAVRLDPHSARLRYNRALVLGVAGRDPRPELRHTLRLNPGDENTRDFLEQLRETPRARWNRLLRRAILELV